MFVYCGNITRLIPVLTEKHPYIQGQSIEAVDSDNDDVEEIENIGSWVTINRDKKIVRKVLCDANRETTVRTAMRDTNALMFLTRPESPCAKYVTELLSAYYVNDKSQIAIETRFVSGGDTFQFEKKFHPSQRSIITFPDHHPSKLLFAEMIHRLLVTYHQMHEQGIYHVDCKPENILWDKSRRCFIVVDFGSMSWKRTSQECMSSYRCGETPAFCDPRLRTRIPSVHEADESTESYSLGLTIYEIMTGSGYNIDHPLTDPITLANVHSERTKFLHKLVAKSTASPPSSSSSDDASSQNKWCSLLAHIMQMCHYDFKQRISIHFLVQLLDAFGPPLV